MPGQRAAPFLALCLGCALEAPQTPPSLDETSMALCGGVVVGAGTMDIELAEGRIVALLPAGESDHCDDPAAYDASGMWIVPAFVDSHVHLAYYDVEKELADGGVAAAVDLAAPLDAIGTRSELRVLDSGPMLTPPGGYPTSGWGAGGYGWELSDTSAALEAVDELHARGAALIKLPLHGEPNLEVETMVAIVERAHELDMPVAVHALGDAEAMLGAELGADILAHTPLEPLSPATIEAWKGGSVVSTLGAFGATQSAGQNLAALRDAGARILYGTDLGNSREVGIQASEIQALLDAGFEASEVLAAGTRVPAEFWGLEDLGRIEEGASASLVLLSADPELEALTLGEPVAVLIDGEWRDGPPLGSGGMDLLPGPPD